MLAFVVLSAECRIVGTNAEDPMRVIAIPTLTVAVALFAAPTAWAGQTCSAEQACPTGFECREVPGVCSTMPACAKDVPCPAQDAAACAPSTHECQPRTNCHLDVECAPLMVCRSQTVRWCRGSAPACAPNTECDAGPVQEECGTTTTDPQCVPKSSLTCVVDDDCGPGFDCRDNVVCAVQGGAGVSGGGQSTPSVDGGSAGPLPWAPIPAIDGGPTTVDAGCYATGKSCQARHIQCAVAETDCPMYWSCTNAVCVPPYGGGSISTGGGTVDQPVKPGDFGFDGGRWYGGEDAPAGAPSSGGNKGSGDIAEHGGAADAGPTLEAGAPQVEPSSGGCSYGARGEAYGRFGLLASVVLMAARLRRRRTA